MHQRIKQELDLDVEDVGWDEIATHVEIDLTLTYLLAGETNKKKDIESVKF